MTDSAARIHRAHSQKSRAQSSRDRAREDIGVPAPRSTHWTEKAACIGMRTEDWFSDYTEKQAKKVCAACPVLSQCLRAYLFEPFGVFGGMTPTERDNYRRNLRKGGPR